MPTTPWKVTRWCAACGQNVRVEGSRIREKNAAGDVWIDSAEGWDAAGHHWQETPPGP